MPDSITGTFEPKERSSGGFLRDAKVSYRIRSDDVVVPVELGRSLHLRGGETLTGSVRSNGKQTRHDRHDRQGGRRGRGGGGGGGGGRPSKQLADVDSINGIPVDDFLELMPFRDLTAIDPRVAVKFETPGGPLSMRVIDLLTPIGLGQRGLIAAPPRTGKTILLQQMAHGIATNHPDVYMMVLLIDERPEEVTDMRRNVRGEVIASSNDENIASHVRIAKLMIEKAKRHVECGQDVVILLDSLTRLGRAFNAAMRGGGRTMSGGISAGALNEPKSIFGAARNVEDGGSLTIIATALIETGSRMDEVIFNEFKGTGNMEIMLSRDLANRRIWPAITLSESGTRKEDLLLAPDALNASHSLRRALASRGDEQAMTTLLEAMGKHETNASFVQSLNKST